MGPRHEPAAAPAGIRKQSRCSGEEEGRGRRVGGGGKGDKRSGGEIAVLPI